MRRPLGSPLSPYTPLFRSRLKIVVEACRSPETNDPHGTFAFLKVWDMRAADERSEEHTSELQSRGQLVCRLLLEKKKKRGNGTIPDAMSRLHTRRAAENRT